MSEESQVKIVYVDVPEILPKRLKKDLHDGHALCSTCGGLGLIRDKNPYGLLSEPVGFGNQFPYVLESLKPCPTCYNGVVRICRYCGKPAPRKWATAEAGCGCKDARAQRMAAAQVKRGQVWEKARKMVSDEAEKDGTEG